MKIRIRAVAAGLVAALLLAACSTNTDTAGGSGVIHLDGNGSVAATVNDVSLPTTLVDAVAQGRGLDPAKPDQFKQAVDELTEYVLLAQQADKLKVGAQADLNAMVEAGRLQGMANAVLLAYQRAHPITDAMVAQDYAEQVKEAGPITYRFTQLLFRSKTDVDTAAAELAAGTPFQAVYDAWKDKAVDARGYTNVFPQQLPEPLANALTALQPGQTSPPVESKLGWHLLHLDGTDNFEAPPLSQVRDTVRRGMEQAQVKAWVESLKQDAKISVNPSARSIPLDATDLANPPAATLERSKVIGKGTSALAPAASGSAG